MVRILPNETDIYALTDSKFARGRSVEEQARALLGAGVKILQYREKHAKAGVMLEECRLSKNAFITWKNGTKPTRSTLNAISQYLQVSVPYLLEETDDPEIKTPETSAVFKQISKQEWELLQLFREMSVEQQFRLIVFARQAVMQ